MAFYQACGRSNYVMSFGEGRPVLLLHGISNSGRAWAPQIPPLVEAGYRVIVPDHAGHGASARLNAAIAVDDLVDDVEQLLDHLEVDTLDVVGLSLGGMIAMAMALRRPARIGRLVVANSFDKTATAEFRAMAQGWARTFEQPHGPVNRLEHTWPSLVSPAFVASAQGLQTWQVWHAIAATTDGASLAHVARGITNFDVSDRLEMLTMPVLFIAGSLDTMSPPALSRAMAERVPDGNYACIEGAAHLSNVDSAEAFSALMMSFLDAGGHVCDQLADSGS